MTHLYDNIINTSLERIDIDFKNKPIIVEDHGEDTGPTIISAIRSVRKNMNPKRLIIVLAVSPKGTINRLNNKDIDLIEVIVVPPKQELYIITRLLSAF
jgi:predicted phosphoribosyltransferase